MCTVCGQVADQPIASPELYAMLETMKHRGPDAHGAFLDGDVVRSNELADLQHRLGRRSRIALGHSRLSIVGRRSTAQPLVSCDGKLTLLHNGEIYNFLELRQMLSRSHEQRSGSDSEVILHLLEELYEGDLVAAVRTVMPLLDGMYVLVVTDGTTVVAARDPIGKKPLYYRTGDGVTSFASERKAFAASGAPERLLPGQILHLGDGTAEVLPGFSLEIPAIGIVDEDEAVERYKTVLRAAIDKRLAGLSEAQVGVIYSGGIDSVLVAKLLQDAGADPRCYCVGTEGSGDVEAARASAIEMGLPVETRILDRNGVAVLLPEVVHDVEESGLLQVEVAIPMYLAARMASEDGIRVMFTGQAADELFAGYDWYRDALREGGELYLHQRTWEDFSLLYDDTLEREDKLTMAHSIELRAPYLDRDVVRTAFNTATFLKISSPEDRMRKRVHRRAAVELGVPDSLAWRPKDPAQTGSGMHQLIEEIAATDEVVPDPELERRNLARDKGSLYRYGLPPYSAPAARTLIEQIADGVGMGGPAHPEAA